MTTSITFRPYNIERDYERVILFLTKTHTSFPLTNWLPARFEYMHYHPLFERQHTHHIGMVEKENQLIAVIHYETTLGEAFFQLSNDALRIQPTLIDYACKSLYRYRSNKEKSLVLYIPQHYEVMSLYAASLGFKRHNDNLEYLTNSMLHLDETKDFSYLLPEGFKISTRDVYPSMEQYHDILWKGFDHDGDAPIEDIGCRYLMQHAPNYALENQFICIAPNGEFASYAGFFYHDSLKAVYVEPLVTNPVYRNLGLAKAVLYEGLKQLTKKHATRAYVYSALPIYLRSGFKPMQIDYPWVKKWK